MTEAAHEAARYVLIGAVVGFFAGAYAFKLFADRIDFCLQILEVLRNDDAPATEISRRLARFNHGTEPHIQKVYSAVRHMERRGILFSREEPGGPERGGRPKIIYVRAWKG